MNFELHNKVQINIVHSHNTNEILFVLSIRYLDNDLARRQTKNPKHAARQKEKAMKKTEENVKLYEKMLDAASKKRDKEQKKRHKELEQKLSHGQDTSSGDSGATKQKMTFFKTLTMRGKNTAKGTNGYGNAGKVSSSNDAPWTGTVKYSDFTGTATVASRKGGIASRIQKKQTEAALRGPGGAGGYRSVRSFSSDHGIVGPSTDIMYVGSVHGTNYATDEKRQSITGDFFQRSRVYK